MKLASQKLFIVAGSALALLITGCTRKPDRPAPIQTIMSQAPGGPSINSLPPAPVDASGLTPRETEMFDPLGQNRSALSAQTVYFDLNQFDLKAPEREKLKAAKEYLDKNPTHRLLLEGHCDWRGTAEYNLGLGDRRANAVKKYLQSLGVPATKLETLSKGSLDANKEGGDAVWAKDRRVDLVVVDPARAAPKAI